MAKYSPVVFFFDKYTLPNAPLLMGLMISKSLIDGGAGRGWGWLTEDSRGETGGLATSEEAVDDCLR